MRLIKVRAVMMVGVFLILTIYKLVQAPQGHLPAFSHTHDLFIKIDTTNVCLGEEQVPPEVQGVNRM